MQNFYSLSNATKVAGDKIDKYGGLNPILGAKFGLKPKI